MTDKTIAVIILFFSQNKGKLSQRAKEKEFATFTRKEVKNIEVAYKECFG